MAATTSRGICVPPGPSKYATGLPACWRASAGNRERMASTGAVPAAGAALSCVVIGPRAYRRSFPRQAGLLTDTKY